MFAGRHGPVRIPAPAGAGPCRRARGRPPRRRSAPSSSSALAGPAARSTRRAWRTNRGQSPAPARSARSGDSRAARRSQPSGSRTHRSRTLSARTLPTTSSPSIRGPTTSMASGSTRASSRALRTKPSIRVRSVLVSRPDAGLQEDDGGEAAFEDRHLPQLGAEGGDVIVRQFRVAAQGIADGSPHGSDGRAVVTVVTSVTRLGLLGAAPRRLTLKRKVDEIAGIAHGAILSHAAALRFRAGGGPICCGQWLSWLPEGLSSWTASRTPDAALKPGQSGRRSTAVAGLTAARGIADLARSLSVRLALRLMSELKSRV